MVGYMPCHVVVFLVDMPIKNSDIAVWREKIYCLRPIASRPVPFWNQIEEGAMSEDHDS